jgi:DNA-binding SARP family transcriptional activator
MLRLGTLGGVTVAGDSGAGISIQRRRLALLCLLAPSGSRGLSRDKILACLWPESPNDNARHALDQLLYAVRRQLGDALILGPDPLRLNPEIIGSDVVAFEQLVADGSLAEAVALYRGPFLDGFFLTDAAEFESWAEEERQRLRGVYAAALQSLIRQSEEQGRPDAGLEWRRRLAALDPLDSRVAAGLIRALADFGNRSAALRHAQAHEALVRQELGGPPDPRIAALVEQLRTEPEPAVRPIAPHAPEAHPPAEPDAGAAANAQRRSWSLPRLAPVLGVTIPLVLAFILARRSEGDPPASLDTAAAHRVAIMPFRVAGPDSSLSYLREGMVDLLAAKLTGEGGPIAVDPRTTLSAWRRLGLAADERFEPAAVNNVARAVDAGQILMGDVVKLSGGRIAVHARLLAVPGERVTARASVEGATDSLAALVDRLAASLLALQAGEDEQRLASLASASLPALHAYLEGRAAYRRGEQREAMNRFSRALEIDSTFGLAAMEYLSAADRLLLWKLGIGDGEIFGIPFGRTIVEAGSQQEWERAREIAWRERERLGAHDRVYLTALLGSRYPNASSARERLTDWENAVAILTDRADAWYRLGEVLLYQGRSMSVPDWATRAAAAFGTAEQLDPSSPQLFAGLVELAARERDTTAARRAANEYLARDSTGRDADFVRWHVAALTGDQAALRAIRARFGSFDLPTLDRIQSTSQVEAIELQDAERAMQTILDRAADPDERSYALYFSQMLPLNRGRPHEAWLRGEQQFAADSFFEAYAGFRVPQALYWEGDTAAAAKLVPRMTHTQWERYLAQLWRLFHHDTTGADRTAADLRACGERCATWLIFLRATVAVEDRAPDAAVLVGRADSIVRTGCCTVPHAGNLLVARLEERLGNLPAALEAVRRQRWFYPPEFLSTALREEGRLAALTGDTTGAVSAYHQYLVLRDHPAPERQQDADRIRSELKRLEH